MVRHVMGVLVAGGVLCLLGCSASHPAPRAAAPSPGPSASSSPRPTQHPRPSQHISRTRQPSPAPSTRSAAQALPTKVLVVIEENHSFDQMRAGMPFLASLSEKYGYATDWLAITHPSEPNYLAIAGGSTFGVTDDDSPAVNAAKVGDAPSVFSQAMTAGETAATYADSMATPCDVSDSYPYAVKHNPWAFFASQRAACLAHDRDASSFAEVARSNRLPNVGFLIPDLQHDAHDGTLGAADAWLRTELTPVLASTDFTSGHLVVVVTADEDDGASGNRVLTSVLTPRLSHQVVNSPLTHYSLTRFIAQVLGVPPLGQGAGAPDLRAAFGL